MSEIMASVRYAIRGLRRNPGFTAIVVLTLALGIGANSAMFSVVRGVLLTSLPYRDPDRLMFLWNYFPSTADDETALSQAEIADWRDHPEIFDGVAAIATGEQNAIWTLTENGETEVYRGAFATVNLFDVLGVEAALGRTFVPEEGIEGQSDVIVLSDWFWRNRFGADPNILGRRLTIRGEGRTVVGVMPPAFHTDLNVSNAGPVDMWVARPNDRNTRREFRFMNVVARLSAATTLEQARARAKPVAAEFKERFPEAYDEADYTVNINPLLGRIVGDVRLPLFVLLGTVAAVLLIASLNVANLLLVRAEARQREIAIRTALGAGRARVVQQFVVESILLSALGGLLGLLVAYGGTYLLKTVNPGGIPRVDQVTVNAAVVGVTALLAMGTGLLMGLAPGFHAARTDISSLLKDGGRGVAGVRGQRMRRILVISEVAMAVVLVIGAGLLLKSFDSLTGIDVGIDSDNVLTMRLDLETWQYPELATVTAMHTEILERVQALPGVRTASMAHAEHPLRLNGRWYFDVEGQEVDPTASRPLVGMRVISPQHLETLRIPLRRGREFDEFDRLGQPIRILINETMARRRFQDADPIGARLKPWGIPDAPFFEIIGVVGDVKNEGIREEVRETLLLPYTNAGPAHPWQRHMTLMVRSATNSTALTTAVRETVLSVDRSIPITNVQTLEKVVAGTMAGPRFVTILLGIFAAIALSLAAIGIYGVISYTVARRTQEIGVRMALGAGGNHVRLLILKQGMWVASIGIALGVGGAFAATRFLRGILFDVSPTDPATFTGVVMVLAIVALLASYIPARRASRIDPLDAVRYE